MRHLLIFLFVNMTIWGKSQVHNGFRWIDEHHVVFYVDLPTGLLSRQSPNQEKVVLGKLKNWDSIYKELPTDFGVNIFHTQGSTVLTIPGTGQLYSLDLSALSLKRLDQTYFRGYNFNATQFVRKDTLFSVGGEGFWQKHSLITFYNHKTQEWDLYETRKENPFHTHKRSSGYSVKQDAFFSADLNLEVVASQKPIPFFVYSFRNKSWHEKGTVSKQLIEYLKNNYESIWTGEHLILARDQGKNKVLILDPFKNVFYNYFDQEGHFFIKNRELYYRDGYLYSRSKIGEGRDGKIVVDSLLIQKMIADSQQGGKVYEPKDDSNLLIYGSLTILLLVIILIGLRKLKTPKGEWALSEPEFIVVNELLSPPFKKMFTTLEINVLLNIADKSYDNQRQIRNRTISAINRKLLPFLEKKELISRMANKEDKRMVDYFINPEIKQKDLEKLRKEINKTL